jgi:predicted RNA-binding protein with PUA-like domain
VDGVRNHRAANNLRAMEVGDQAFFYHSNIGLEIVGICEISQSGLIDPTDETGKWACVKVKPVRKLKRPVSLKQIKADPQLAEIELMRLSRLSVSVITQEEWDYIIGLSEAERPSHNGTPGLCPAAGLGSGCGSLPQRLRNS